MPASRIDLQCGPFCRYRTCWPDRKVQVRSYKTWEGRMSRRSRNFPTTRALHLSYLVREAAKGYGDGESTTSLPTPLQAEGKPSYITLSVTTRGDFAAGKV